MRDALNLRLWMIVSLIWVFGATAVMWLSDLTYARECGVVAENFDIRACFRALRDSAYQIDLDYSIIFVPPCVLLASGLLILFFLSVLKRIMS